MSEHIERALAQHNARPQWPACRRLRWAASWPRLTTTQPAEPLASRWEGASLEKRLGADRLTTRGATELPAQLARQRRIRWL
jgi:hypothetical protein